MEKLKIGSSLEKIIELDVTMQEPKKIPSALESVYSRKIKLRALVFKAQDKDLCKIKELIETQFPEVEIIYVTTVPAASILHVTKSMPFETQNYPAQPLYTTE